MHKSLPTIYIFLDQYNNQIFKKKNTNIGIIYRNYNSIKRENELIKIAKACKRSRYQLFVSNDVKLALKVKAEGIYVPSFNKTTRFQNMPKNNIKILGSAHNQKEIQTKIMQNCNGIFLSPLFFVKKSKTFLGLYKFNNLCRINKINIYALGGINEKNIRRLNLLYIAGFGGIGMFKKKPAFKRPVLIKK